MGCSMPGFSVLHYLLEFAQAHVHWVSDVIQPAHPLSSLSPLPSVLPSIKVSFNESTLCISWPKYWPKLSPPNEYSGLISFRIDRLDLLAVQGTVNSLLQHHSSKESVLWCFVFMIIQLSHQYTTTGKTIFLNIQAFISNVMSRLLNTLSKLVIAFLPRRKYLLIS